MKLKKLIQGVALTSKGSKEIEISGICADSRLIAPGNLFIAKRGVAADGNQFILQAQESGAAAVLSEVYNPFLKITQLIHPNPQEIVATLASRFFGDPSKELYVAGVTGTKGKTTTAYLIKHLLDAKGKKCSLSGTVETILGEKRTYSTLTTHDAIHNQKILREMKAAGSSAAVLEASSHGLMQGRLDSIEFDAAIFTKLTPDHLDYHPTMEHYAAAKKQLFKLLSNSAKESKWACANIDDAYSKMLLKGCSANQMFFGLSSEAEVRAGQIVFSPAGTRFEVEYRGKSCAFHTSLIGRFNVYNLLGAISLGLTLRFSLEEMAEIFANFQTVPGRLERVPNCRGIHVFVDYAHNGDALENVLTALREIARRKIIVVFGAGGGRDPGRRSGMAKAAEALADRSIITTDNPRQEDPEEICRQILSAFTRRDAVQVEIDRQRAIEQAIGQAEEGDIVLIAGKGHERVQIFSHQTVPFDDCAVAREALAKSI